MRIKDILIERINIPVTVEKYGKQIADRAKNDHTLVPSTSSPERIISRIISNDPTPNSMYFMWILRNYLDGSFASIMDIEIFDIKHRLDIFNRFKSKISLVNRDINRLSLREFINITEELEGSESGKKIKKLNYKRAQKESELIYNGPEGSVWKPNTLFASQFFGYGTKWCTKWDNQFHSYQDGGTYFVIIPKNSTKKYALSLSMGDLRDENNTDINWDDFAENNPWVFSNNLGMSDDLIDDLTDLYPSLSHLFINKPAISTIK